MATLSNSDMEFHELKSYFKLPGYFTSNVEQSP